MAFLEFSSPSATAAFAGKKQVPTTAAAASPKASKLARLIKSRPRFNLAKSRVAKQEIASLSSSTSQSSSLRSAMASASSSTSSLSTSSMRSRNHTRYVRFADTVSYSDSSSESLITPIEEKFSKLPMWDFDEDVAPVVSIAVQPHLPIQIVDAFAELPEAPVVQSRIAPAAQLVSLTNVIYSRAVLALGSAYTILHEKALEAHIAACNGIPPTLEAFASAYLVCRAEALSSYATLSTITHLIAIALVCVYHFAKRVFACKYGATSIRHGANLVMLMVAGTWAVVFFAGSIAFVLTFAMFQLHDIVVALVYSYLHQRPSINRVAHLMLSL